MRELIKKVEHPLVSVIFFPIKFIVYSEYGKETGNSTPQCKTTSSPYHVLLLLKKKKNKKTRPIFFYFKKLTTNYNFKSDFLNIASIFSHKLPQ